MAVLATFYLIGCESRNLRKQRDLNEDEDIPNKSDYDKFEISDLIGRISNNKSVEDCSAERLARTEQCSNKAAFLGISDFIPPSNRTELEELCG